MDNEKIVEALDGIKGEVAAKFEGVAKAEDLNSKADKTEIETKADKAEVESLKEELEAVIAKFDSLPAIINKEENKKMDSTISQVFEKNLEESGKAFAEIEMKALNQGQNVTGAPTATLGITASLIAKNPVRALAHNIQTTATAVQLPILGGGSDFVKVGATRGDATNANNSTSTNVNIAIETYEKLEHVSVETASDIVNFDATYANRLIRLYGQTEAKEHVAKIEAATAVTAASNTDLVLEDFRKLYDAIGEYEGSSVLMVSSEAYGALSTMSQSGAGSDLLFDPRSGTFELWGRPVVKNPYMASIAAGNVVAALADWSEAFAIVDRKTFELGRYTETRPGHYSYYANVRMGSAIWHGDAIRVLQLAA